MAGMRDFADIHLHLGYKVSMVKDTYRFIPLNNIA